MHYRQETGELFVINHAYSQGGERIDVFKVTASFPQEALPLPHPDLLEVTPPPLPLEEEDRPAAPGQEGGDAGVSPPKVVDIGVAHAVLGNQDEDGAEGGGETDAGASAGGDSSVAAAAAGEGEAIEAVGAGALSSEGEEEAVAGAGTSTEGAPAEAVAGEDEKEEKQVGEEVGEEVVETPKEAAKRMKREAKEAAAKAKADEKQRLADEKAAGKVSTVEYRRVPPSTVESSQARSRQVTSQPC